MTEFLCAPFTEAQSVDPCGTAGTYDAVLVVHAPLPWPHDIGEHAALAGLPKPPQGRSVRILGMPEPTASGATLLRYEAAGGGFAGTELSADALGAAVAGEETGGRSITGQDVLLCTHGARDRCCGNLGTRLHLAVAGRWDGVRVVRISHTGGHRFAPTALVMPMGVGWAYLDEARLDGIVHRSLAPADLADHHRGSLRLPEAAQLVDRALFVEHGWDWLDVERAGDADATVTWDGGRAGGTVTVGRQIQAMACGVGPDGDKTFPELVLSHFEQG
jgi:hypothetical protein